MRKERGLIVFGLLASAFIVLIKIYAGEVFSSYTFMVSGYYTLIDMAILFLSFMGSVARGRRASKDEPFGYGKVECYSGMFFGIFIGILSIFIIVKSFFLDYTKTQLPILLVVIFVIIFKLLDANYKYKEGKDIQSEILIESSIDAYYDALINVIFLIVIIVSANYSSFDLFGSIFGGILILRKGLKIFFNNLIALNGVTIKPQSTIKKIEDIVNDNEIFAYSNSYITKIDTYKKLTIDVLVEEDASISSIEKNKASIKRKIKREKMGIKIIDFKIYKGYFNS